VIDYKTGRAPFLGGELRQGVGAQLLMYARGAGHEHGLEPAAVRYLSLGRNPDGRTGVFLKKHLKTLHDCHARNTGFADEEFDALYDRAAEHWVREGQRLQAGDFAPRPARGHKECKGCAYRNICGYQGANAEDEDGEEQEAGS
jgi:ATP-dependent helicase/DNAse subunit B